MSENKVLDIEFVARAIFLPAMLDSNGTLSLAAFSLRHNEGYFSVARMAVEGWLEDIKRIPTSSTRQLGGYCKMGVADIRHLGMLIQTRLSQLAGKSYVALNTDLEKSQQ